jgi:hypothetical protein
MATTERTDCTFTVKEQAGGEPFIMLELYAPGLKAFGDGFLSLELAEGVSMEQAQSLAQRLNDQVRQVSFTKFNG